MDTIFLFVLMRLEYNSFTGYTSHAFFEYLFLFKTYYESDVSLIFAVLTGHFMVSQQMHTEPYWDEHRHVLQL